MPRQDRPLSDLPFRNNRVRYVWLVFLAIPVLQIAGTDPTPLEVVLQALGLIAWLTIAYRTMNIPLMWEAPGDVPRDQPLRWIAALLALTMALTVLGVSSWTILFPPAAIFTVRLAPIDRLWAAVLVVTAIAAGCAAVKSGGWGAVSIGATTFGLGVMMAMVRVTADANVRLREAQDELAQLAVSQERLRFARDMHDLIGHSLSVIALKAELAGRLIGARPEQATQHVADIESVAREALSEVREVVSGYRQPLLEAELAGARMALDAAGILADVAHEPVALPPASEAVLAWAVREGTTNVIRHSRARHCTVAVIQSPAEATVEVADDGHGPADGEGADGGNGLAGLRERAGQVHGHVVSGSAPGGGFRLRVTVPTAGAVA